MQSYFTYLSASPIYRRVKKMLITVCRGIEQRYEILFLKIGIEENHVHFLIQSVPTYSLTKIVQIIKSIT